MNKIYLVGAELTCAECYSFDEVSNIFLDENIQNRQSLVIKKLCDMAKIVDSVSKRDSKKIDRSVQLAIHTVKNLLNRFALSGEQRVNTGVCLGNNFGGWSYVESQMVDLYESSENPLNPYVATAWFPAAGQGEISIRNKLYGHSKTFACDQLSSAIAFDYGADLLRANKLQYVIVGGYESLVSDLTTSALKADGIISKDYPASEAACSLLLTSSIENFSHSPSVEVLYQERSKSLLKLLDDIKTKFSYLTIDYCILPPVNLGNNQIVKFETNIIKNVLGGNVAVGMPTHVFGEVCAASYATQLATALWVFKNDSLPKENVKHDAFNNCFKASSIKNILVIGREYDAESYYVTLLSKLNIGA